MPSLSSPLKWHGGKTYLAKKIIALMPKHTHYVEPYFGGGSVLFEKDPEGVSEVVNDIDSELTNFWACLQNEEAFQAFTRQVEATPFSEAEFRDSLRAIAPTDCAEGYAQFSTVQAVRFFIRCRQSLAARMGQFSPLSRIRIRRGMNEQASAWLSAVEGLPAVHARLKRVVVLNRDALDVIRSQDGPDTLFYLDPPYLGETRTSSEVYAHEMTVADHWNLLGLLPTIKGKFLLSGYWNVSYDQAAEKYNWRRHEFDLPNNAAHGPEKRRMTECVWANF